MSSAYRGWTAADIGDLEGRTVIVTGASSGIGAATARALAVAGARVIAAVRDLDKGRHTTAGMRGRVEVRHLDLSDLASVRQFADGINDDIDVLVNNAGVMGVPHARTVDGFELQLGTNHLGPFALTGLVLPRLRDRVVTVSSQAHRQGRLRLDDLHAERGSYDASAAYAASKLANLLFAYELHRRLQAAGSRCAAWPPTPGSPSPTCCTRPRPRCGCASPPLRNATWANPPPPARCPCCMPRPRTFPAAPTSAPTASTSCADTSRWSTPVLRPRTPATPPPCGTSPNR